MAVGSVRAALVCDDTGQELDNMPDLYAHAPLMPECIDGFPHISPALSRSGRRSSRLPRPLQRRAWSNADELLANAPTHASGSEDTAAGVAPRAVPGGAGGVGGNSKNGCRCDSCQECLLAGALESLGEGDSNPSSLLSSSPRCLSFLHRFCQESVWCDLVADFCADQF